MIQKFQQGGQQDAIMQFVQGLAQVLQADPQQVVQAAQQNPKALEAAVQTYQQTQDMNQAAQVFTQAMQQQVQAARHGAKLQYIRSLKNQCAEDEELYYYKKGGSVGCGCKKKEDGGEINKAQNGVVANFKMRKAEPGMKMMQLAEANKERKKKKAEQEKKKNTWGANSKIVGKDYQRGSGNDTSDQEKKDKSAKDYYKGIGYHTIMADKCGSKVVKKFKKHRQGGSLNEIPFYQEGTPKRGITEKSDNTRVQKIPNKEEGVYEEIPINGWDFVPVVGTYKEAQRLDQEDPNSSITRLGISLAGDLAGAGMIGSVVKAAGKAGRIQKVLKSRGFFKPTNTSTQWIKIGTKETPINARRFGTIGTKTEPAVFTKTIPTVDYTPAVMTPLVQTLRVPAEAPFFNYSK